MNKTGKSIPEITVRKGSTVSAKEVSLDEDEESSSSSVSPHFSSRESSSVSLSVDAGDDDHDHDQDDDDNLGPGPQSPAELFKSASSASLAALKAKLQIPSHKRFGKFIHKYEVPRKALHVSIGFVTLWLYTRGVALSQVTPVLVTMLVGIGSCDFIRFKSEHFNKLYCQVVGFLMREKEVSQWNGVIWYLVGLIAVFLIFPKDIALLAVLLLSWADTAASTIGRTWGHLTPKLMGNKSLAGTLAAFVVGVVSSWALYGYFLPQWSHCNSASEIMWTPETSHMSLAILCLMSGFIGALSEAIDVFDDNLTIPVLSSATMYALMFVTNNGKHASNELFSAA